MWLSCVPRAPGKSPLVSIQGYWTEWQRFASSSIHHFWDTLQHFLKKYICLERWFSFIPRAPQITASNNFRGCWTQWQRFESSSIYHFWDTLQHFLKTHFCWQRWLSFIPRAPEKSLLVSFQGYWTQWQRFTSSSIHHFWDTLQHFSKHIFA